MLKRTKYLYIVITICLYTACNYNNGTDDVLRKAENNILEYPDISLRILDSVDIHEIHSKEQMANYALLYSQALDKNLIDITDDSLINIAVEYFEKNGDPEKRFLSYFYKGRIHSNAGDYTKAMLSYTKAESLLKEIDNPYATGLLYARIGEIFDILYNYPQSLLAYTKAYQYYGQAGKEAHQMYAKINIGQCHINTRQYDIAEKVITEVLEWSVDNNNNQYEDCISLLSTIYTNKHDISKLDSLFNSIHILEASDDLTRLQAKAYISANKKDAISAVNFLEQAWTQAKDINDTATLLQEEYRINKILGNYEKALHLHEKLFYIQDTIVRSTLQKPIITAQRNYFQSQNENNLLKLHASQHRYIAITSIAILMLCIALLYIRNRIKERDYEITRYIEITQDLQKTLVSKNSYVEDITKEVKQMNEKINILFHQQFSMIDKLSNVYYETHSSKKEKEAIYSLVKKEIERLQDDRKHIAELENIINYYKNGVMDTARRSLPEFKETDFRLLCYFFAGFSAKAISIFTGDSTCNIYMKKSRLKAKIQNSAIDNKEEILKHLQ